MRVVLARSADGYPFDDEALPAMSDATPYHAAKAEAQRRATATGVDHGVRWHGKFAGYVVRMLPDSPLRQGEELTCEVVRP